MTVDLDSGAAQSTSDGRVGPKQPITAHQAVCSSQHPIVTQTMAEIMRDGGTAFDAAIAGCLVQATVQQEMTNHAGTITFLCWDARGRRTHELNSWGTIVPGLTAVRPVPAGQGYYASDGNAPFAVIPGFMPGLKAIFERFATRPWSTLCEPAVKWAECGHSVESFEHFVLAKTSDFFL